MISLWFYRGKEKGQVAPGTEESFKELTTPFLTTLAATEFYDVFRTPQLDNDDDEMNQYTYVYWFKASEQAKEDRKDEYDFARLVAEGVQKTYPGLCFEISYREMESTTKYYGPAEFVKSKEVGDVADRLYSAIYSLTAYRDYDKTGQVAKYYDKKTLKRILQLADRLGIDYKGND